MRNGKLQQKQRTLPGNALQQRLRTGESSYPEPLNLMLLQFSDTVFNVKESLTVHGLHGLRFWEAEPFLWQVAG